MTTVGGDIAVGSGGGGGGGVSDHGDLDGLADDDHTQYSLADGSRGTANLGDTTGTLPVASGGTGATDASGARTNLGALGTSDTAANSTQLNGQAASYYLDPANLSSAVNYTKGGTAATSLSGARFNLGIDLGSIRGGRLCTSSTDPLDGSAGSVLYYTSWVGEYVASFFGSTLALAQISASTDFDVSSETDLDGASIASSSVYDVFVYYSGGAARLALKKWTNATTRATSLSRTAGVYYILVSSTYYRYVGTIRTSSTTQVVSATGRRYIWNAYNRVTYRDISGLSTPTDYTCGNTGTWRTLNNANYDEFNHRFVNGMEQWRSAEFVSLANYGSGSAYSAAIRLDGSAPSSDTLGQSYVVGSGVRFTVKRADVIAVGYHNLAAYENNNGNTQVFLDNYGQFIAGGEW